MNKVVNNEQINKWIMNWLMNIYTNSWIVKNYIPVEKLMNHPEFWKLN